MLNEAGGRGLFVDVREGGGGSNYNLLLIN